MNKLIAILIVLLTTVACAPEMSSRLSSARISNKFSSEQIESIENALEQWKAATNGEAALDVSIVDESEANIKPVDFIANGSKNGAWGVFYLGEIQIKRDLPVQYFKHTALHELGHSFGMPHSDHGVMGKDQTLVCLSAKDLQDYCQYNACANGTQPTCETKSEVF